MEWGAYADLKKAKWICTDSLKYPIPKKFRSIIDRKRPKPSSKNTMTLKQGDYDDEYAHIVALKPSEEARAKAANEIVDLIYKRAMYLTQTFIQFSDSKLEEFAKEHGYENASQMSRISNKNKEDTDEFSNKKIELMQEYFN